MVKGRTGAIVVLVAGAAAWFLLSRNNDEQVIRRNLQLLAKVASNTGDPARDPAPLARLATIRKLLTEDCRVIAGEAYPSIVGRDELLGAIAAAIRATERLTVTLHDVSVEVARDRMTATTDQTIEAVSARAGGKELLDAREARIQWRKVDRTWRIAQVEEVPTLH